MVRQTFFAAVLGASWLSGCAGGPSPEKVAAMNDEARKATAGLVETLGGELKAAIGAKGPAEAIGVCKEKAPQLAAEASQKTGLDIKRVSPKNRNPNGAPDAWESAAFVELEKRLAAGEKPEALDMHAVVDGPEGKVFRYAKALVTQPLCLTCHGPKENLPDAVREKLSAVYPDDKATGYAPGSIRGLVSIKKKL